MGIGTGERQFSVKVLALLFIVGSRNPKGIFRFALQQRLASGRKQLEVARAVVHHAHIDQFRNPAHQLVTFVIQTVGRIHALHIGSRYLLVELAQAVQVRVDLLDALIDVVVHLVPDVGQRVVGVADKLGQVVGLGQQVLAGGLIFRLARQLVPRGEKGGELGADALGIGFVEDALHTLKHGGLLRPALLLGEAVEVGVFHKAVEVAVNLGGIDPLTDLPGTGILRTQIIKADTLPAVPLGIHVGDVVAGDAESRLIGEESAVADAEKRIDCHD